MTTTMPTRLTIPLQYIQNNHQHTTYNTQHIHNILLHKLAHWNKAPSDLDALKHTLQHFETIQNNNHDYDLPWTEKYAAGKQQFSLLGREHTYQEIQNWMAQFQLTKDNREYQKKTTRSGYNSDSDSDFVRSDDLSDSDKEDFSLENDETQSTLILHAPVGLGKNMIVDVLCEEWGYIPKEISSNTQRSKNILVKEIEELLQSRRIGASAKGLSCKQRSLLVLDEVDTVFDDEVSFNIFVNQIMKNTRLPVILLCNSLKNIDFDIKYAKQVMIPPPELARAVRFLSFITILEGGWILIDPDEFCSVLEVHHYDLRKIIHHLELFLSFSTLRNDKDVLSAPGAFQTFMEGLTESDYMLLKSVKTRYRTGDSRAVVEKLESCFEKLECHDLMIQTLSERFDVDLPSEVMSGLDIMTNCRDDSIASMTMTRVILALSCAIEEPVV